MNGTRCDVLTLPFEQWEDEYIQICQQMCEAQLITDLDLRHPLQQSLRWIVGEIQAAINDGAVLTLPALLMLCAAHACQAFQKPMDKKVASYAYTLYVLTQKLFAGQGEAF